MKINSTIQFETTDTHHKSEYYILNIRKYKIPIIR